MRARLARHATRRTAVLVAALPILLVRRPPPGRRCAAGVRGEVGTVDTR